MKPKRPAKSKAIQPAKPGFDGLLRDLREFISESRRQVLRAVDVARTCWGVGRHGAGGVWGAVAAAGDGEADGGVWARLRFWTSTSCLSLAFKAWSAAPSRRAVMTTVPCFMPQ